MSSLMLRGTMQQIAGQQDEKSGRTTYELGQLT